MVTNADIWFPTLLSMYIAIYVHTCVSASHAGTELSRGQKEREPWGMHTGTGQQKVLEAMATTNCNTLDLRKLKRQGQGFRRTRDVNNSGERRTTICFPVTSDNTGCVDYVVLTSRASLFIRRA